MFARFNDYKVAPECDVVEYLKRLSYDAKGCGFESRLWPASDWESEKTVSFNLAVNRYLLRIKDQVAKRPFHMLSARYSGPLKPTFSTATGL